MSHPESPSSDADTPKAGAALEPLPVEPVHLPDDAPLPSSVTAVPVRDMFVFPGMVTPLIVSPGPPVAAVRRAASLGTPLLFVTQRDGEQLQPEREDLFDVATVGRLLRVLRFNDGSMRVLVEGLRRVRLGAVATQKPALRLRTATFEEVGAGSPRVLALVRLLRDEFRGYVRSTVNNPPELDAIIAGEEDAARLGDYIATNLPLKVDELAEVAMQPDLGERLELLRGLVGRETELATINASINANVQAAMDKSQCEYYLKEQLRAVREELGEYDPTLGEIETLREKVKDAGMPDDVLKEALRELDRMDRMHRDAAEYTVARTYIDWLLDMPWQTVSEDTGDVVAVARALDEDHSGLKEVKERVLEYLSVRQLNPDSKGPILCLTGPPGVGKTSLGRSIARALGREFQRTALGGVKDESEIRGHRRTYIGSMPGRIVQALKRAGTRNPVLVLDEIDKVGNDFRGDPASALLEALDPEQNNTFTDHYLDVPFDLSQVMFVCTANVSETIPPALRDRMEIIELPGYIEEEKVEIARDHLVPKTRKNHGLKGKQATFDEAILHQIIRQYTSEAGVRGLERELAKVARKVAHRVVRRKKGTGRVTPKLLIDFLGPRRYFQDQTERTDRSGIAVGLAWTPVGGEILFIEATRMEDGAGKFKVTGQLGDVMKESAEIALSWVRGEARSLGIEPKQFKDLDFHVHVPGGAIPKDGPSAGVTIVVALVSLLTGRKVNHELAMTGEVTLRGKVLPVGGIKEKILGARRAGIKHVLMPSQNEKDLLDVPELLRQEMKYTFIDHVDEVWENVFAE